MKGAQAALGRRRGKAEADGNDERGRPVAAAVERESRGQPDDAVATSCTRRPGGHGFGDCVKAHRLANSQL